MKPLNTYEDKYEYILQVTLDKNLISNEKVGILDLRSNLKVHNYDTNKMIIFCKLNLGGIQKIFFELSFKNNFLANLRNINYEAKNVEPYKNDTTVRFLNVWLFFRIKFEKISGSLKHFLTPKVLFRYSPGSIIRKEEQGFILNPIINTESQ